MKTKTACTSVLRLSALALMLAPSLLGAADITKANNTNTFDQALSWIGGAAPTASDVAVWSGEYSADVTTNTLRTVMPAAAVSWQGIRVGTLTGTALTTNTIAVAATNIVAASQLGTTVTITTKANHGFVPGQTVKIAGVTPAGYNGTFTVERVPGNALFTYTTGSGLTPATAFGTVEGNIYVGGVGAAVANSSLTLGSAGIDLSGASHSVTLVATGFVFNGNQTWTVPVGRNLRLGANGISGANAKAVTSGNDGIIDISGTGSVDANQGGGTGMADAGGFTGFTGKWRVNSGAILRGLRNGATAWGSNPGADSITLNGGTLAVGGVAGAVGSWSWTNQITLASGMTSYIEDHNVAGTGRYLKLNGVISGSGNLVFRNPMGTNTFTDQNLGFILTGANTMSGVVTIAGPTENGIPGRLSYVRVGGLGLDSTANGIGPDGTLGTATIVNNGVLTFSLNTAITVNTISGTGSLRVGYAATAGAESQNVTLTGVNTYFGYTRVNMGTLTLGAGASVPNTSDIFLTPLTGASLITVTLDVTQNGGLTLNNGQRLVGGANNASLNNIAQVSGNVAAGTGSAIVPGGTNVANTLVINGDLTLTGGATLVYDLGNTTASSDLLTVANLNPSGVTTFAVTPPGTGLFAGTYPLIQVSGALNGTPANFAITGLSAGPRGQTFSIAYDTSTPGSYTVNLVVVGSPGELIWQGNGINNNWDAGVTKDWSNTVALASDFFYPGDQVTFDDTGLNTPAVNLTGALRPSAITINALQNYTFSGAGQIAGPSGLSVSNSGTLTLLTSNTFTGPIALTGGGVLAITNETALNQPASANAQSLTLDNGSALKVTNSVTIGANTNRGIIIGTGGATLIVTNGATLAISNVIGDLSGVGVLTKTGNGTLVLSGNNNYGNGSSGSLNGTIVKGGTVIYGSAAGLSRAGNTSGTSGFFAVPFELDSGVVDINGMVSYQPNFAGGSAATGTGVILYNGTVNVNGLAGAPLVIRDSAATPSGWGSAAATVLNYSGANSPGTLTIGARFAAVGTSSSSTRTFNVDDSPAAETEVDITAPIGVTSVDSTNQDGRNVTIIKNGMGTLQISAANTFPILQVDMGTLRVNHALALGADRSGATGVSGGTGSPHQLIVTAGTVDLNGFSPAIGALNDNGTTTGAILNNGASASLLTLGYSLSNQVNNASYASVISNGTSAVALTKIGTNVQALAGLNTYSGTTTVSNGTLLVNGQIGVGGAGSKVIVAGGALGGSGVINAPVEVQTAGALAPAADTNITTTLTINGNLSLAGTTVMNVNKDAATNDLVVLTAGGISYGGVLTISTNLTTATTLALGDTFKLFSAPSHTGNFSGIAGSPGTGLGWSFNAADGTVTVVTGVASNPTNITYGVSGSTLTLSWPADHLGWIAQSNSVSVASSNAWYDIPGSGSATSLGVTINPANPAVFYRLRQP